MKKESVNFLLYLIYINTLESQKSIYINTIYVKRIGLSSPEFKRVGEQAVASSMNLEQIVKY